MILSIFPAYVAAILLILELFDGFSGEVIERWLT